MNFSVNKYTVIFDKLTLIKWLNYLKKSNIFAFYLKTDSLDIFNARIIGIAFAIIPHQAVYLPLENIDRKDLFTHEEIIKELKIILENNRISKIGYNLKHECNILKNYNIQLNGIIFDIMIESYCINSVVGKHDIITLSEQWLNSQNISSEKTFTSSKELNVVNNNIFGYYAANTVNIILQLHFKMWSQLQSLAGPKRIFREIESPLTQVISRIERNGVLIDPSFLIKYSHDINSRMETLKQNAFYLAGEEFNLSSTKQLQVILFEKHGIKPIKHTPRGYPSINEDVLEQLGLNYPLANIILQHRRLSKLKSTYIDKLPLMINPVTGRIHASYNQVVTITGRLSCKEPNLQNIPVRSHEGRCIRKAFIAAPGYFIVSADYSQIELRILAHLSQDEGLLNAFILGKDIHRVTASEIFNVTIDKVSNNQRLSAKAINFGLIYGMSVFGLSRQLNISHIKAKEYIALYFKHYPQILSYMEKIRATAVKLGYVETIYGRRLWLPFIQSKNKAQRQAAERTAINAPMQGTAADIIKLAMIDIDRWIIQKNIDTVIKMIIQVHDELIFEIHGKFIDIAMSKIRSIMENVMMLDVPLKVLVKVGKNWEQTH